MKIIKFKILAVFFLTLLLILPLCNAASINNDIISNKNKSKKIKNLEEELNNFDSKDSISKLFLILKIIRISIVTFGLFLFIDKISEKSKGPASAGLEILFDLSLSLVYSIRINHIYRELNS